MLRRRLLSLAGLALIRIAGMAVKLASPLLVLSQVPPYQQN